MCALVTGVIALSHSAQLCFNMNLEEKLFVITEGLLNYVDFINNSLTFCIQCACNQTSHAFLACAHHIIAPSLHVAIVFRNFSACGYTLARFCSHSCIKEVKKKGRGRLQYLYYVKGSGADIRQGVRCWGRNLHLRTKLAGKIWQIPNFLMFFYPKYLQGNS